MYMNKDMPSEENKQEEGPGAFLSLSAQVPSSPFRGSPAVVSIKQEEGDLETCLSLQQPTQQQPVESPREQQAFVHAQEPLRTYTLDQSEAPCIANPLYEQKAGDSSEQTTLSISEGLLERQKYIGAAGEIQSSSLEYEQPSSLHTSACTTVQRPPEQQRPTATWLTLAEQQRGPTSLGLSQLQKPLEHPKETSSGSFAQQILPSFHDISGQQKPELSLPVSPLSLQLPSKQEKHVGSAEEEKPSALTESEKMPPLQSSSEQNSSFLHRPGMLSPQAEQEKDAPIVAQQEQHAFFPSKEFMDEQASTHLHSYPDQQKLSLSQQWHKSAFMQASAVQGALDPPKDASRQGPHPEQKFNFIQGYSSQQKDVPERKAESQVIISHSQLLRPQQGFMLQSPSQVGVVFSKPNILVTPNALLRDKEPNLSMESALACVASSQSSEHVYPDPLATQEAVLADRRLFMEGLRSFHAALNSQVSVPKIEGMELDLYKLYKEVTSRGGLEAVYKEDLSGPNIKSVQLVPTLAQSCKNSPTKESRKSARHKGKT